MTKKTRILDIKDFSQGLVVQPDETKAPIGSAREMTNMLISDRGNLAKRPGTELLGTVSTVNDGIHGLFNYKKSNGQEEVILKAYDTKLEYYHDTAGWSVLVGDYTSSLEFGFKDHNVNTENEDYVYFCNGKNVYSRWPGTYLTAQATCLATGTTLEVDSTVYTNVFSSGTASSGIATVVGIGTTSWVDDQWIDFYIKTSSNQIRKITDNTSTSLTFDALSSAMSAGETFEIVKNKIAPSGALVIEGVTLGYSAIPYTTAITITAPSSSITSGTAITTYPGEFAACPRGNRMDTLFTRMYVGGVNAGRAYSTADALQGSYSPSSIYYSKIKNATDYTFTATRVAGEGGIESFAYGSGPITDVACQEETVYVFKRNQVESLEHDQSSSDLVIRKPISTVLGSVNRVVKGENDIYFATEDKQITSIGRLQNKDFRPQNLNVGYKVKRLLDTYEFDDFNGIKYNNRLLFAVKDSDSTTNDRVLVYNEKTGSFEGEWSLGAYGFTVNQGNLYYGDSVRPNVYKMFTGTSDQQGSDTFGITSKWRSNWINLTPSQANQQSVNALAVSGWITVGTTITFTIYKDFSETASVTVNFSGTESSLLDADNFVAFLGGVPLGVHPLGAIGDPDGSGKRHFHFLVYLPFQYANWFSLGVDNFGKNQDFEISSLGLGILEDTDYNTEHIKEL